MNLIPLAANMTELGLNDRETIVLFSYRTPVAARYVTPQGKTRVIKTEKFWSKTTSRHINKWLSMIIKPGPIEIETQAFLDGLVK